MLEGLIIDHPFQKALIPLATDNTDVGKVKAAQALAKIAITSNPEIAFPGERVKKKCKSRFVYNNANTECASNFPHVLADL